MTIYQRELDVTFSNLGNRQVLVKRNRAFEINETALRVWQLIDGKNDLEDISKTIAAEYAVDQETAILDCKELIDFFKQSGFLAIKEG